MRKLLIALSIVFAAETAAAAQTSKYGIPSTNGQGATQLLVTTVGALPVCDVSHAGIIRMVTDATTPTYNATLTGGGAVKVMVICNGTNWMSQ